MAVPQQQRRDLRTRLRRERRNLAPEVAAVLAAEASVRLMDLPELGEVSVVTAYMADDGELDPAPSVRLLQAAGVVVGAPLFVADEMGFAILEGPPSRGRFGLLEPTGRALSLDQIDVIIAPLVAVDLTGTRLGRGAGYYDSALAHLLDVTRPGRPLVVGLAYDHQIVSGIERRDHDVALDFLVTPSRVVRFAS